MNITVIQEILEAPNTQPLKANLIETRESWMHPILNYLLHEQLPEELGEAQKIKRRYVRYTVIARKLYKMGRAVHMLRCLSKWETKILLAEVYVSVC